MVTLACICYQAILLIFAHKSGPQAPNTQPGVWLVWTGPRPLPLLVFWSRQGSAFNLGWPKDQTTRKNKSLGEVLSSRIDRRITRNPPHSGDHLVSMRTDDGSSQQLSTPRRLKMSPYADQNNCCCWYSVRYG